MMCSSHLKTWKIQTQISLHLILTNTSLMKEMNINPKTTPVINFVVGVYQGMHLPKTIENKGRTVIGGAL